MLLIFLTGKQNQAFSESQSCFSGSEKGNHYFLGVGYGEERGLRSRMLGCFWLELVFVLSVFSV